MANGKGEIFKGANIEKNRGNRMTAYFETVGKLTIVKDLGRLGKGE